MKNINIKPFKINSEIVHSILSITTTDGVDTIIIDIVDPENNLMDTIYQKVLNMNPDYKDTEACYMVLYPTSCKLVLENTSKIEFV